MAAHDVSQHGFHRLAVHAGFGHPDTNRRSETVQRRLGDTGQLEHPVSGFRGQRAAGPRREDERRIAGKLAGAQQHVERAAGQRYAMLPAGFHSRRRDRPNLRRRVDFVPRRGARFAGARRRQDDQLDGEPRGFRGVGRPNAPERGRNLTVRERAMVRRAVAVDLRERGRYSAEAAYRRTDLFER